jgi:proliferating cell nuclear antigen PCNA
MKLTINNNKKDTLIALFQIIKNSTCFCNMMFKDKYIHIQGMDKTHVCLFNVVISNGWFDEYERNIEEDSDNICFDSSIFHSIISSKNDSNILKIHFEGNADYLNIDLISDNKNKNKIKGDFDKHFKIPLTEFDYDVMELPDVEYDADFCINSKKICEITSQMLQFGNELNVICDEEKIHLITKGINGEMLVNIPIEDLDEYSIVEGEQLDLLYSLTYIDKLCLTNKLSQTINFSISKDFPMKISYDLGDNSNVIFYIAPKTS